MRHTLSACSSVWFCLVVVAAAASIQWHQELRANQTILSTGDTMRLSASMATSVRAGTK